MMEVKVSFPSPQAQANAFSVDVDIVCWQLHLCMSCQGYVNFCLAQLKLHLYSEHVRYRSIKPPSGHFAFHTKHHFCLCFNNGDIKIPNLNLNPIHRFQTWDILEKQDHFVCNFVDLKNSWILIHRSSRHSMTFFMAWPMNSVMACFYFR